MYTIDPLIDSLYTAASHDETTRGKTLDALRQLQLKLETPNETLGRLSFLHLDIVVARLAADLDIYQLLASAKGPLTVTEIAAKTGAAVLFLRRILRYLSSVNQIAEVGQDSFAANNLTRMFAEPGYRGAIYHSLDNIAPALQALPEFMSTNGYRNIEQSKHTPAQLAFGMDKTIFEWLPTQPKRFEALNQFMTVQHITPKGSQAVLPWHSVFPLKEQLAAYDGPDAFIDVGGGFGHQCVELLAAVGDSLRDRLVVQDLPETLANMPAKPDGVRTMGHDFFTPQPLKGAKFYYMRNVLHDWTDEQAVVILGHLRDAMVEGSQLLIDEMVMPTVGANWHSTSIDMIMMSFLGSRERTVDDWHALLRAAGLKIVRIDAYMQHRSDSVIQAVIA